MSEAPFIVERLLPDFCYDTDKLVNPYGAVIHFVSARYTAPNRWDDVDTIWNQTVELNRPGYERGPLIAPQPDEPRAYASYHHVIDRAGNTYHWTPLDHRAYHAGASHYWGRRNLNSCTLGWALIATETSGYPDDQYEALTALARYFCEVYGWDAGRFAGHDQVAVPRGRKHDPGPLFDWARFRAALPA